MATTTRPNRPLPLLLLLGTLLALLAHGSPLATPASSVSPSPRPLQPAPRALSPAAQATPTTGPRMPYPIPDTYNGTAFGRPPHGTGTGTGAARATGTGTGAGRGRRPPAQVTAAPGPGRGRNGTVAAAQKDIPFIQTTYWSCVQWPTTMHCGWHEPILAVGDAAVAAAAAPGGLTGGGTATRAARRACVVVGAGLLAGFGLGFV